MSYLYVKGAVRWKRHNGKHDVRACRPNRGWDRSAMLLDYHPITGRPFRAGQCQWWFRDEYMGGE